MRDARLISVDPSLTCSGWACFSLTGGGVLGVGKIRSLSPKLPLSQRLLDLQQKIESLIRQLNFGPSDVLVCEAPTTMRDPHAAIKVEQVRCIFETGARRVGAAVPGRLNPRSVHREVMGLKGKQLERAIIKDLAVQTVRTLYGAELRKLGFEEQSALSRHQDIVDALLIGTLALARVQSAQQGGMALELLFESKAAPNRSRNWAH